jgi:hypothetical protein
MNFFEEIPLWVIGGSEEKRRLCEFEEWAMMLGTPSSLPLSYWIS